MKTGFYAKTQAEEPKCPNLELNVLQSMEDVTAKVNAAAKPGMSVADQGQAQRAAMSAIEKDCAAATGLRCDVMTLYSGARLRPVPLQEIYGRAAGVRAGIPGGVFWRRSRQF